MITNTRNGIVSINAVKSFLIVEDPIANRFSITIRDDRRVPEGVGNQIHSFLLFKNTFESYFLYSFVNKGEDEEDVILLS